MGTPKYTPAELQKKIEDYFEILANGKPSTITGLCYHCGYASRQSFYDLEKDELFSYTIKRARLKIEINYEEKLMDRSSATGAIFALKNFGWSDKQEIDHTSGGEPLHFPYNINVESREKPNP